MTIGDELVFRDDEGQTRPHDTPHERHDTGWQRGGVDLSRWRGQEVVLRFAVWNREYDGNGTDYYNTWAYLDQVQLEPGAVPTRTPMPTSTATKTPAASPTATSTSTPTGTNTPARAGKSVHPSNPCSKEPP